MKYLSNAQVQESLEVLRPFHVFFSTTFLVLKAQKVPVGAMKRIILDSETKKFLDEHFLIHPRSEQYFRVMKPNQKNKDWVKSNYPSTSLQAINTQSFRRALLHELKDITWGWTENYVQELVEKLPRRGVRISLFHLAVWLYKYEAWDDSATREDVTSRIIYEYNLTDEELSALFQPVIGSNLEDYQAFQATKVQWQEILAPYSLPEDVPAETSGILTHLETAFVGPTPNLVFRPAPRLSLITGDNGLGKTFILDLAWWALTRNWAHLPATPSAASLFKRPRINFSVEGGGRSDPVTAEFLEGTWKIREDPSVLSGLVVYARVDGSFAIWDPANRLLAQSAADHWPGITFTRDEVWDGKHNQIEGLVRDLVRWQERSDRHPAFNTFVSVIEQVYPPDLGNFAFGDPVRIPNDPRDIPTMIHPYGEVPIVFESAGIRRIMTLAYLLVWVWEEHRVHAKQQSKAEERQIAILLDEAEAHLHPKWQRLILPGLMNIARELQPEMEAQWIITSHSPLVLASVEGVWEDSSDRLFHLDLDPKGEVRFSDLGFEKRGTVDSWLSSDLFALRQPGSKERESAIQEAIRLQTIESPTTSEVAAATEELKKHLAPEDPFWTRWIFFAEPLGALN